MPQFFVEVACDFFSPVARVVEDAGVHIQRMVGLELNFLGGVGVESASGMPFTGGSDEQVSLAMKVYQPRCSGHQGLLGVWGAAANGLWFGVLE